MNGPAPDPAADREWMTRQAGYNRTGVTYSGGNYGSRLGRSYLRYRSETLLGALRQHFGDAAPLDALELGCGTGLTLDFLANERRLRCWGLDFSSTMLREAAGRARGAERPPTFLLGNAIELPFADASFDAVYATRFIHQFPHADKLRIAAEIERVLRPGGLVLLEFYARALNLLRYYVDQHDKYPTREKYFSHYPSRAEVREIVGPDYQRISLRFLGDRVINRVLGYGAFRLGDRLVTRVPGLRWLTGEAWVAYTPARKRGPISTAARAESPPSPFEKLRCPSCRGSLAHDAAAGELVCAPCRRGYAIEDGIPNLLSHEARAIA